MYRREEDIANESLSCPLFAVDISDSYLLFLKMVCLNRNKKHLLRKEFRGHRKL